MKEVKVEIKNMKTNESKVLNGFKPAGDYIYIDDGEGIYVILSDPGIYFMSLVYYTKGVKKVCWGHRWSLEENVFECDYNNILSICFNYGMNQFIDNFYIQEDWIIPPYTKEYEPIVIQIKIEYTSIPEREDGFYRLGSWDGFPSLEYWDERKKKIFEKIIEYGYSFKDLSKTTFSAVHLENVLTYRDYCSDGVKKIRIKGKGTFSLNGKH